MKTKEQLIKEAYSVWYNESLSINPQDGSVELSKLSKNIDPDFEIVNEVGDVKYIRPKSLKGFENNNGWVSIETLPKNDGEYLFYFADKDKIESFYYYGINHPMHYDEADPFPTHWQPLPKKPLY